MKLRALAEAFINVSEKAAILARTVRCEEELFKLLVEEKNEIKKNDTFVRDFKTLTDVLVQELVKHDICKEFPDLDRACIHGEESNEFTNALGETVTISIQDTREETQRLLASVLDNNQSAAALLADVIHRPIERPIEEKMMAVDLDVMPEDVSVWIDPIDSTSQYICGRTGTADEGESVYTDGLQCVSVLLGVYHTISGQPFLGVVNQPFHHRSYAHRPQSWEGRCVWGICYQNCRLTSDVTREQFRQGAADDRDVSVVASSSEPTDVLNRLRSSSFRVQTPAGAGYKLLVLLDGYCCAYVHSLNVTYRWDTCAAHAILRALGGGIVTFLATVTEARKGVVTPGAKYDDVSADVRNEFERLLEDNQIVYHLPSGDDTQPWSNDGGLIAYINAEVAYRLISALM